MGQGGSAEPQRSPFDDQDATPTANTPTAAEASHRLTLIPTVLQWSHGGRMVYVTGTFNNWAERIPMRQSRSDFTVCLNLPVGTFQYKFIVDNEWRFSPTQPLVQDAQGNVNNCITVLDEEDFMSEPTNVLASLSDAAFGNDPTVSSYGQSFADDALQLAKDPPPLPSQLTRIVLNFDPHLTPPTLAEEYPLPLPCTLLHLCWCTLGVAAEATAGAADAVVVSASHRFRAKFVTLVLYKPPRWRGDETPTTGASARAAVAAAALGALGSHAPALKGRAAEQALRASEMVLGSAAAKASEAAGGMAPPHALTPAAMRGASPHSAAAPLDVRPPSLMQIDGAEDPTPAAGAPSPQQMVL